MNPTKDGNGNDTAKENAVNQIISEKEKELKPFFDKAASNGWRPGEHVFKYLTEAEMMAYDNIREKAILARLSAEHEKEIKELKRQFALANAAADFSYQEARDLERRLAAQKATHEKQIQEINKQKDEIVEQRDALLKGMALNEAGKEEYISKSAVAQLLIALRNKTYSRGWNKRESHMYDLGWTDCIDSVPQKLGISPEHPQHDGQEEAQA